MNFLVKHNKEDVHTPLHRFRSHQDHDAQNSQTTQYKHMYILQEHEIIIF